MSDRRAFVRYVLLGGCGAGLDLGLFMVLVAVSSVHPVLINLVSTTAGIALSFALNARFTFGVRDRLLRRFVAFLAVGAVGLAVTALMLQLGTAVLSIDPRLVKAASLPVVAVLQFLLNRHVTFRVAPLAPALRAGS